VVDPRTQSTVFAQSVDGIGSSSTLASIDSISRDLRISLGENLKTIERSSAPLPNVTTASLEALRLYAAALQHYNESRPLEALALFERAIAIDSDFALAWIGMARCHYRLDQFEQADAAAARALALRERLPTRDALYVEAWRLSFGPPGPSREKWKQLGAMYPDYYAAHYNDALFGAILEHDFRGCVSASRRLDAPQNPNRGEGLYLRASCEAGLERVDEAISLFERSVQLGANGHLLNFADTYATRRDYAAADRIRATADLLGGEAVDLVLRRGEIMYAIDRGEWAAAEAHAEELDARARMLDAPLLRSTSLWRTSLLSYRGASPEIARLLRADLERERGLMRAEPVALREMAAYGALGIGYVAARSGDRALLEEVLAVSAERAQQSGYPLHLGLLTMLQAESQRLQGRPQAAIEALAERGSDPLFYQYRVAHMRALAALDRPADALQQADWLASHRGRAYAEQAQGSPLMLLNVVDSNLALLDGAEFALALGDRVGARRRRDELLAVWPTAMQIDWLAPRLATLDHALRGG
jgi:tetratricopeptide (TPR) repeat protein